MRLPLLYIQAAVNLLRVLAALRGQALTLSAGTVPYRSHSTVLCFEVPHLITVRRRRNANPYARTSVSTAAQPSAPRTPFPDRTRDQPTDRVACPKSAATGSPSASWSMPRSAMCFGKSAEVSPRPARQYLLSRITRTHARMPKRGGDCAQRDRHKLAIGIY